MLEMRWGSSGLLARWWVRIGLVVVIVAGPAVLVASLLHDPSEDSIKRMVQTEDVAGLEAAVESSNEEMATRAVAALGKMGKRPKSVQALLKATDDPRPVIREQAALALATAVRREHVDRLRQMLREDKSPQVRASAAATLGRIYACEAVPDLIDALEDDDIVYDQAKWSLGRIFGMIPGYKEADSSARRKRMAKYYEGFWKRYDKRIREHHDLNEH